MPGNQVANTSSALISASAKSATQPFPRTESPPASGPSDGSKPRGSPFSANQPPSATQAPPGTPSAPSTLPSGSFKPQDNPYEAIGGVVPPLQSQMQAVGSVAYEGLKTVLQGLYDCSDMFLPLKTAAGGLLTVIKIIDVCGSICRA